MGGDETNEAGETVYRLNCSEIYRLMCAILKHERQKMIDSPARVIPKATRNSSHATYAKTGEDDEDIEPITQTSTKKATVHKLYRSKLSIIFNKDSDRDLDVQPLELYRFAPTPPPSRTSILAETTISTRTLSLLANPKQRLGNMNFNEDDDRLCLRMDAEKEGQLSTINLDGIEHDFWTDDEANLSKIVKGFVYSSCARVCVQIVCGLSTLTARISSLRGMLCWHSRF